jgi:hypothetical protein
LSAPFLTVPFLTVLHIQRILPREITNLNWRNAKEGPMTWGQIVWFVAMGIIAVAIWYFKVHKRPLDK